uniref:Uncharacterized protein n=1 Tax=Rhizophora mucronata TaxID=61149 RepID=A0A2P2KW43_RHIMU
MDLESLTYDESLVPSYKTKPIALFNSVTSSLSLPSESGALSAVASMTSPVLLVEDCPRLLAAAQTLCDIANHISRLNQDGMVKWPKKPSQKTMKARKPRSTEKYEEKISALTSSMASHHSVRSGFDQIVPSKRPKLLISGNQKDDGHINGVRRGLLNWSTPRSSRSSPNKSTRDTIGGTKHSTTCTVKEESFMKLPPAKVPNRNCNGQPKVWKLTQVDCKRECED